MSGQESEMYWPFDQAQNTAVITLKRIVFENQPILHVSHDAEDGGWQFLDLDHFDTDDAAVVSLHSIVSRDPTIVQLADLPEGCVAWRGTVKDGWTRIKRN